MYNISQITGHYVEVNGFETYYEEAGSGQPILCLAMAGASGSQYHFLMQACASETRRFIAVDLPGRGKSLPNMDTLKPIEEKDEYLDFIWALVEKLNLAPVILLGTAMTATAVLMVANAHPDKVKAVIACNGGVVPKAANDPGYSLMLNHPSVNLSDYKEAHIPGLCGKNTPQKNLNLCIWYGAKTQVPDTAVADVKVFSRLTVDGNLENLERLRVPVLLLNGGEDVTISAAAKKKIEALSACKSVTVPGAGHYMMMEKPEETAEEVCQFLNKIL
ncbi:MAG: alpha/beta fold hydrolase [Anaerovoracaceae bacterium]